MGNPAACLTQGSIPSTLKQENKVRNGSETHCVHKEVRDEGVCDYNADEQILDTERAEHQVEEAIILHLTAAQRGVACSDATVKETDAVLTFDKELEEDREAERHCQEAKHVFPTTRKPKIEYRKGTRKQSTQRDCFALESLDVYWNPGLAGPPTEKTITNTHCNVRDSNCSGGQKRSEARVESPDHDLFLDSSGLRAEETVTDTRSNSRDSRSSYGGRSFEEEDSRDLNWSPNSAQLREEETTTDTNSDSGDSNLSRAEESSEVEEESIDVDRFRKFARSRAKMTSRVRGMVSVVSKFPDEGYSSEAEENSLDVDRFRKSARRRAKKTSRVRRKISSVSKFSDEGYSSEAEENSVDENTDAIHGESLDTKSSGGENYSEADEEFLDLDRFLNSSSLPAGDVFGDTNGDSWDSQDTGGGKCPEDETDEKSKWEKPYVGRWKDKRRLTGRTNSPMGRNLLRSDEQDDNPSILHSSRFADNTMVREASSSRPGKLCMPRLGAWLNQAVNRHAVAPGWNHLQIRMLYPCGVCY